MTYPTPSMLRGARAMLGLSQDEVARRARVSPRTLVSVEQGKASRGALHSVMGAYHGMGIIFAGSQDYQTQTVTVVLPEPPAKPPIPD